MHQLLRFHARRGAMVAVLTAALLASGGLAAAQTASPAVSPGAVVCDVEPRTDEDLDQLAQAAATPAGDSGDGLPGAIVWEDGVAADDPTRVAIESALAFVDACAETGDVARLLALYTDEYIVREVLATEPVPILPGTPDAAPSSGTPEAADAEPNVREVRMLPDGRVAAQVEREGRTEIVVFVEVDGRWLVDEIAAETGAGGTPEAAMTDDMASLPPVRAAVADAAEAAGIPVSEVTVTAVEPTEWPDSSLGCPQPDQFYAQVVTPGYVVTLDIAGTASTYHTDEGEAVVPCEAGGS